MATLFVRHTVADYAAWKKVYDEFDAERKTMGVISQGVYQLDGNPNDITVYHEFPTMESAKAFASNEQLKATMQRAGVSGPPTIWFTSRA